MKAALTGGIGSGKSFVLSCFAEQGWATIDCDAIARELTGGDAEVISAVRERFGGVYFDERGVLNRKKLAAHVFADAGALDDLENILQPKINAKWREFISKTPPNTPSIVEIPLLFEKNLEKFFDISVCVTSDEETRLARLAQRGLGRNEALARMKRQLSAQEKELRADFAISNNGNKEFTRAQVVLLTSRIH